jgi:dolichol-phosphate mannosyltransferase
VRLLIAIPVYNERKYVNSVLNRVRSFHRDVLVIDDASNDGTQEILAARPDIQVIRHATNQGYGQSLIDAFNYADRNNYDWVITMDCDEQHEPEMIPAFIDEIRTDRWDLISGSRYLEPRKDDDLPPGDRRSINATITEIVNGIFGLGITDAFCGFKAHRVAPTVGLKLDEKGYAFPMQLWPRVAQAGLRLREIPVRLIYNDPNRYFGGKLDDAAFRLQHYLSVLRGELERFDQASPEPAICSGCGCE